MKAQISLQRIILTKFEEIRSKNPAFSRRAFSKRLGLSAGAMSEILNGRRQISMKLAEKIASKLSLDPQERSELFSEFSKKKDEVESNYLQLSADQFHIIGDWYHFAILSLMETKDFKSDPQWISERLGISPATAKGAIERLKRLEMISADEGGTLQKTGVRYRTTDDISNVSVRKAHFQYLEKAGHALATLPVTERDFTALMLALNPEDLPKAKEMIREFQDQLAATFSETPRSEVYQICVQLFPLTQKNKGETK